MRMCSFRHLQRWSNGAPAVNNALEPIPCSTAWNALSQARRTFHCCPLLSFTNIICVYSTRTSLHERMRTPCSFYWHIYLAKCPRMQCDPKFLSYNLSNWRISFGFIVIARRWAKAWRIILTQISSLTNIAQMQQGIIFWWPNVVFTGFIRMFLIDSPIVHGDNLRFHEEGVREVISRVLPPWLNSFRFFIGHVALLKTTGIDFQYDG